MCVCVCGSVLWRRPRPPGIQAYGWQCGVLMRTPAVRSWGAETLGFWFRSVRFRVFFALWHAFSAHTPTVYNNLGCEPFVQDSRRSKSFYPKRGSSPPFSCSLHVCGTRVASKYKNTTAREDCGSSGGAQRGFSDVDLLTPTRVIGY